MPAQAPGNRGTGWALKIAAISTLAFCGLELTTGYYSHSLSVVADGWHNFSDGVALLLGWLAGYARTKAPSRRRTYGYGRASVLAGFAAALSLLLVTGMLFYFGYQRLLAPQSPHTGWMLLFGLASLGLNSVTPLALRRRASSTVPRHVLGQMAGGALASLCMVGAAVAIALTGMIVLDTILAFLIGGLIVWTTWEMVMDSLNTLLEALPRGMNLDEVVAAIRAVEGVEDVHDVHVWTLGPESHALSCHVRIAEVPIREGEEVLRRISAVVEREFGIRHTTVQVEDTACDSVHGCVMPAPEQAHGHRHHH